MGKKLEARYRNLGRIMECLYRNRKTSRVQIAETTGLTPAAVTNLIAELQRLGVVEETGDEERIERGGGRSRKLIRLCPDWAVFLGIGLSNSGLWIMAADMEGRPLYQKGLGAHDYDPGQINEVIIQLIAEARAALEGRPVLAGGITLPGHYREEDGTIVTNNPRWRAFRLPLIEQAAGLRFAAENSIESMALAEYLFQESASPERFLFLHAGPGLYASFFSREQFGKPQEAYYQGEIGHTTVDLNGNLCECGKKGCLQTYISDTWLIRRAQDFWNHAPASALRSMVPERADIQISHIVKAARMGDAYLQQLLETGIAYLAMAASNTLILHPADKIYVDSLLLQEEIFREQFEKQVRANLTFVPARQPIRIEIVPFDYYRYPRGAVALAIWQALIARPDTVFGD